MLNKHNLVMIKRLFTKKTIFFLLLLPVVAILAFSYKETPQQNTNDKARANVLAEAYQELEEQSIYKTIEIGKPTLLYDGTKITVYDIQIFQPQQVSRSGFDDHAKYLAIALDIEINKDIKKINKYNSVSKSIEMFSDKASIDGYFAETIFDLDNYAYNPHSMKWAIQELEYELRLLFIDKTTIRLDPYFTRLAFDKESAQPSIFRLWSDYQKRSNDTIYVDAPRKMRGWVTWIFKVDEAFADDKVDYTFAEGMLLKYKNSGGALENFID